MNTSIKRMMIFSIVVFTVLGSALPTFAEVVGYVTKKDEVIYEYDKSDLMRSLILGTKQAKRYESEELYAVKDDIQGYIDINDLMLAIITGDETFDVDAYTESDNAKKINIDNVKKIDGDGNVVNDKDVDEDVNDEDFIIVDIY